MNSKPSNSNVCNASLSFFPPSVWHDLLHKTKHELVSILFLVGIYSQSIDGIACQIQVCHETIIDVIVSHVVTNFVVPLFLLSELFDFLHLVVSPFSPKRIDRFESWWLIQ